MTEIKKYTSLEEVQKEIAELEQNNKDLNKTLQANYSRIKDLKKQEELLKYGKKPCCHDCQYSIGLGFSMDGWHNLCANEDTFACTCCHDSCEHFAPHNEITKYIADHVSHISVEDLDAYEQLIGDIFHIENWNRETIDKAKRILKFILTEDRVWKE